MERLIYLDNAATTKTAPEVSGGNAAVILQKGMEIHPASMDLPQRIRK